MARARTLFGMTGVVLAILLAAASPARAGVAPEACCRPGVPCIDLPPEFCTGQSLGVGTTCAANGTACVPTVGAWGFVVMALAVLIAGTIVLRRSEYVASAESARRQVPRPEGARLLPGT